MFCALLLALGLAACAAGLPEDLPRGAPGQALPPQPGGPLAELEARFAAQKGPETSGFALLDANSDALKWRLALIDSAQHSLDLQYYVWWGDEVGALLAKRLIMAADRGVRVRIIIDDVTTLLADATSPKVRDDAAAVLAYHRNIEMRLFNPWRARSIAGRLFESIGDLKRANQRMHNKLMIADNRAAIIGGRNLGNEYFGLSSEFNFRDMDTLGLGPVARQASTVFDRFWNSEWVRPVEALGIEATAADFAIAYDTVTRRLVTAENLETFSIEPRDWQVEFGLLFTSLHPGRSQVYSDRPDNDGGADGSEVVDHLMPRAIRDLLDSAREEVLITNAYIIPSPDAIGWLKERIDRGVRYDILTNSLASHDVPAVNAHYKQWRRDLLEIGVALYEMRADGAVQSLLVDTPPVTAEFMGLHVKAMVIDAAKVFIGSMNFDPRSWSINSEMGVVVESPGFAAEVRATMLRDRLPENAWRVLLDRNDEVIWVAEGRVLDRQPARSIWQRVEDFLFMASPRSVY